MARSQQHRCTAVVALTGMLAVLGLAACGSSGSSAASDRKASGSPRSVSPPTGTVIKIGVVGSQTGPNASSNAQGGVVAAAWADYVNKDLGGINGHPVDTIVLDDKGDPVTAQAAGKELIADGVHAVLSTSDTLLATFDDALIAAKIPIVSGELNIGDWFKKPGMFPVVTDPQYSAALFPTTAKLFGHATKYADITCSEFAACATGVTAQKAAAEKLGLPFTDLAISASATSYTAQCLKLQQDKDDFVGLAVSSAAAAKFVQDCQAQGFNPTWSISQAVIGQAVLALKNATIIGGAKAMPESADTAPAKRFREAMTKFAKSDNWHYGNSVSTWSGLEVIRKALAGVSATAPVTAATIMDGLYSIKDDNLDGLLANRLTFVAGKAVELGTHNCAFVLKIENGKESTLNDAKPFCVSS